MGFFTSVMNVFSNRPENSTIDSAEVPSSTRNRVMLFCSDIFGKPQYGFSGPFNTHLNYGAQGDHFLDFWREIYQRLRYRLGQLALSQKEVPDYDQAFNFVMTCTGEQFLDFIEDIFHTRCINKTSLDVNDIVAQLNEFLRTDSLPFHLTNMVITQTDHGNGSYSREITAYPQIICNKNQFSHESIIIPALDLLQKKHFKNANEEFLAALQDYRNHEFRDCLTRCCSAFESVLKVICHRKKLPHDPVKDTSGTLIPIVVSHMNLDTFFKEPLMVIATLRNRLSTSHGSGTKEKIVSEKIAQYAINATASAILLLGNEAD